MADYNGNHLDGLEGRDEVFFCIDVFLMTVDILITMTARTMIPLIRC